MHNGAAKEATYVSELAMQQKTPNVSKILRIKGDDATQDLGMRNQLISVFPAKCNFYACAKPGSRPKARPSESFRHCHWFQKRQ